MDSATARGPSWTEGLRWANPSAGDWVGSGLDEGLWLQQLEFLVASIGSGGE